MCVSVSEKFVPRFWQGTKWRSGMWLLLYCVNNQCKKQTKCQFSMCDTGTSPWKKMLQVTKSQQNFMLITSFLWHPGWCKALWVHSYWKNNRKFHFSYGSFEVFSDAWLHPNHSAAVLVKNLIPTIRSYHIFQIFHNIWLFTRWNSWLKCHHFAFIRKSEQNMTAGLTAVPNED
jgi:hypothetical protein